MNGTLPLTEDLVVFVSIADIGSLNGAARSLGLPKSTLSRRLARLEQTVGVRLFVRTGLQLQVTNVGTALLAQAKLALQELQALTAAASLAHVEPKGRLRVSLPRDLASYRDTWLDFLLRYPEVALEVELTNRYVDLAREGFDVALRGGRGEDESLVARRVGEYQLIAVASRDYADRSGTLASPADLRAHSCILFSELRSRPGQPARPLLPHRHVIFNDAELARTAALRGLGVAILSAPLVRADLDAGRLVTMLSTYDPLVVPLYAVYPGRLYLRGVVKAFIAFVEERFGSAAVAGARP